MKIMLMDASKLVNLVLTKDVFGNYWIVNDRRENLVNVEAVENNWVLKSNSEVKVFRNGTAVDETLLEEEKFYTLKNVMQGESYVIYTCPVYDEDAFQLNINLSSANGMTSWYIGNNGGGNNGPSFANIISYEQPGIARNQIKLVYNNGQYTINNINPQIPMYINGLPCEEANLKYGDTVFILGLKFSNSLSLPK